MENKPNKKRLTLQLGFLAFLIIGTVLMLADSDRYKFEFSGDEEREEYIQWIKDNSMIRTDTKVSADDHILMMSTCAEATGENRVVVYGKLVRKSN